MNDQPPILPLSYYNATDHDPPKWLRRDIPSFFSGAATGLSPEEGEFNLFAILTDHAPWQNGEFNTINIPSLQQQFFDELRGRLPSYFFRRFATEDTDRSINEGHPYIPLSGQSTIASSILAQYRTKWEHLWATYESELYADPLISTHLTDSTEEVSSGSSSTTKTLNTQDTKKSTGTSSTKRTGTDTLTYNGSDKTTNIRTGSVKETPTGQVIEDNEGITARDYSYAFDTPSAEDSPGSPVNKTGRNMTTTTKYDARVDTTEYNNLKDESTRTFTSRNDTTNHNTTDTIENDLTDDTTHTGTVKDEGENMSDRNRSRVVTGYSDIDMNKRIADFRKNWLTKFFAFVFDDIVSIICTHTYDWSL